MKKIITKSLISLTILLMIFLLFCKYSPFMFLRVISGSMFPDIEVGDILFINKTKDVKLNDIITYQSENYYVTHQVVEINGDTVITKGKVNNENDSPIKKDAIVGKTVLIMKPNHYTILRVTIGAILIGLILLLFK